MNKIPNIINCVNCRNVLSRPILLPCSHSVCKIHISQSCMCNQCGILHSEGRFLLNKALSDLIDYQFSSLDFGQTYKQSIESCDQLNGFISKLDQLIKDPDNYMYEVFSEMRRNVDLKYEEYKLKLDKETQRIRDELDKLENLCKQKLKSNDLGLKELAKAKEEAQCELDKHMSDLNMFKLDENKWKEIQQRCQDNIDCLEEQLCKFKESLFLNEFAPESFILEFIFKIDVNPLFEIRVAKMNSKIINGYKMENDLLKLCEIGPNVKFSLLYRGSRDGFGSNDFHSKCDNKSKTLTIVKSTSECIFGGYTEAEWNSTQCFQRDPNAYLFSLINKENEPIKIKVTNEEADYAIRCNEYDGPKFGKCKSLLFDRDLFIANDSNIKKKSHSNLGNCYKHPKYEKGSEAAKNFLAGSYKFQVTEIEVFQIH